MNPLIYPGSSSFFPGMTSFGYFDNDYQFQVDADRVVDFVVKRLGYPILDVELIDENIYMAFENAVITYGNEVSAFKLRDNMLSIEGSSTSSIQNNIIVTPNMANIIKMAQQYGAEAGIGGNVNWYSGSVTLTAGVQDYDLNQWSSDKGITGSIEVRRVFHYPPPASVRFYDPIGGMGAASQGMLDNFGMGGYSTAATYTLMPISYDMQSIQAIEMSDTVRRSGYSFEILNNKLRIFPIPNGNIEHLWIQYLLPSERISNSFTSGSGLTTNVSNAHYINPIYSQINSIGRAWIFEYTLSICKEMLGYVRGKYQTVQIPNDATTLNHSDLTAAAIAEKQTLIDKLRAYLDETSKQSLLTRRNSESDSAMVELIKSPLQIYIG